MPPFSTYIRILERKPIIIGHSAVKINTKPAEQNLNTYILKHECSFPRHPNISETVGYQEPLKNQ